MSTEKKAKAYDKALERAKRELQACGSSDCDAAKQIYRLFPELKESKESGDEKIRKALVRFHKSTIDVDGIKGEDIIAWLEKQGEPSIKWNKNIEGNKPQKNHSVLMKTTHGIAEGEWNGDDSWIQYRWSSSVKDSDVLFWIELSDLEKQGEQKKTPIEGEFPVQPKQEWSEEDEDILNTIINHFKVDIECTDEDDVVRWLKSLKARCT